MMTGATQNAHESFQGIVWQHWPKEWYAEKKVVDISSNIDVILLKHGAHSGSLMCLKKVAALSERIAEGESRSSRLQHQA